MLLSKDDIFIYWDVLLYMEVRKDWKEELCNSLPIKLH